MGSRQLKGKNGKRRIVNSLHPTDDPGDYIWFDVAPGWTQKVDGDHIILAHEVDTTVYAIPISTIRQGDKLPRLCDLQWNIRAP